MRCPKCGFISFDNVEACLKCRKPIPDNAKNVQGSVYNVAPPAFLKFGEEEEEVSADGPDVGDFETDEEFEITDPELNILLEEDDEGEGDTLSMEDDEAEITFDDEADLAGEFGEIEAFSEESSEEDDIALDLGMMEDSASLDIPDELADISDLSPPLKAAFEDEPEAEAKPASKDSLDDELDFGALDEELADLEPEAAAAPPEKKKLSLEMDEDLDFELDLGGLSIHDDK